MSKRIALLLLVAACGEPVATSPDAGATPTDFIPPPPDAAIPTVPLRCVYLYPPVEHKAGSITAPETWLGARDHYIDGDLTVSAPITVQGCTRIHMADGASIELLAGGSLQPPAGQTGASGIVIEPNASAWGRIWVNGGAYLLNGASLIGGGKLTGATVTMDKGKLQFQGLTITNTLGTGLVITAGTFAPSTALTITGSTVSPVQIPAGMVDLLPTGGTYTGNVHDEIDVPTPDTLSTSHTWHNLGVPYRLKGGAALKLNGSGGVATLTLDPGTTLAFDLGGELDVDPTVGQPFVPPAPATGALHAIGTATQPIMFTSSGFDTQGNPHTKAQGDWQAIYFGGIVDANTRIDQARIEFAGASGGGSLGSCPSPFNAGFVQDAAVRFRGGAQPTSEFITNTTIADSATNGIDRSYLATSDAPDFTLTNTFVRVPQCHQTHPRINGRCPATNQCD